jgi:hypothetical protein
MSDTSWYSNTQLAWNTGKSRNSGNGNLDLILFDTPILTSQLVLDDLTYTANPR